MTLEAGRQLLHYRLIEKIGEGGMGVVWKAVDTTLNREVAIKVLPELLSRDADRVARLEREAKVLASLNHPNVATLHGLHVDPGHDATRFLVMELVEGDDLAVRLERDGALPVAKAVEIARQIAEGLEAAHASGIIHRDLKPANVKVTSDGRVKLLDFGLARAFEAPSGSGEMSPTLSPTLTSAGTVAGTILGTAAYMSPEQARGHSVDARTDLWSFGVVLYEMLSGRAAFKSDTVSDTLASVLKVEPDLDALPADVPRQVQRLVARCLQKDRTRRLHHIADARIMLEEIQAGVAEEPSAHAAPGRPGARAWWIAALVVVGLAGVTAGRMLLPPHETAPHRKILLSLDGEDPDDTRLHEQVISPDGTRLAYRNGGKVFVRDLDDWASREIVAAAGASGLFWSPDGESLGFQRDAALWRVSPDGGAASKIADLPDSLGSPSWGSDGAIVMTGTVNDEAGLWAVSDRGGDVQRVVLAEGSTHFHGCEVLPDGRGVLTTLHERPEMQIGVVAGGKLKKLFALDTTYLPYAAYSTTGHVLYYRGETNVGIWARPFSLKSLEITGEPFLVAAGGDEFSVSRDGTLVYVPSLDNSKRRLVWVDRAGETLENIGDVQAGLAYPNLSPDDRRLAVRVGSGDDQDIWIIDLARGTQTRLTFEEGTESRPVWTPDGKRVLYVRHDGDSEFMMITDADGGGAPERLGESRANSLSPDGRYVIEHVWSEETKGDLLVRDLQGDSDAVPLVATAADEIQGKVSPDGDYFAYASSESGRFEIYLKRFPSGSGKWQVSVEGGTVPRWNPRGGELFWQQEGKMMRVDVETRPSLKLGKPSELFSWEPDYMLGIFRFDVSADGQRFVLITSDAALQARPNQVMLVENWLGGL